MATSSDPRCLQAVLKSSAQQTNNIAELNKCYCERSPLLKANRHHSGAVSVTRQRDEGVYVPLHRRATHGANFARCPILTRAQRTVDYTGWRRKKGQRVYFESNTFCLIICWVDSRLASSLEQSSERDQNCEILATFKKNLKLIYSARTLTSQPEMRLTQWSWTEYWRSINFIKLTY